MEVINAFNQHSGIGFIMYNRLLFHSVHLFKWILCRAGSVTDVLPGLDFK